ncbi:ACT domain-containing protein [Rhodococcus sp. NBC_00294]|uniref:ACT domain-containing protein n=1 Tax=Rhodococcus sp. NBC_00294 TaxID=2976004 RepID=UPI002E2E025E|nr:ACT domain-containing protein [Rhodococcus sp. NBC_00294]
MTDIFPSVSLVQLEESYVVARLDPHATVDVSRALSVTRTSRELSLVCVDSDVPADAVIDGPWVAFYTEGAIAFGTTGVVAAMTTPLADIGCPVFVVSTFDGDLVLVPAGRRDDAVIAMTAAGHRISVNG